MANEFAGLIKADLASLNNAAAELAQHANLVAPAAQFNAPQSGTSFSFAQTMQDAVAGVNAQDLDAGQKMADVDAGRVIDHQAIQAWADSLGTDKPLPPPVE